MRRLVLGHGFVYDRERIFLSAVWSDLEEEDVAHTVVLRRVERTWDRWDVDRRFVGHVCFDGPHGRRFEGISVDGDVQIGDASGFRFERIDDGPEAPSA